MFWSGPNNQTYFQTKKKHPISEQCELFANIQALRPGMTAAAAAIKS